MFFCFFFLMVRRPPRSTRTDTLFPYTTLFRSTSLTALFKVLTTSAGSPAGPIKPFHGSASKPGTFFWPMISIFGAPLSGEELADRSEEHTSELQSLMRISYAVFCLKKKKQKHNDL